MRVRLNMLPMSFVLKACDPHNLSGYSLVELQLMSPNRSEFLSPKKPRKYAVNPNLNDAPRLQLSTPGVGILGLGFLRLMQLHYPELPIPLTPKHLIPPKP